MAAVALSDRSVKETCWPSVGAAHVTRVSEVTEQLDAVTSAPSTVNRTGPLRTPVSVVVTT